MKSPPDRLTRADDPCTRAIGTWSRITTQADLKSLPDIVEELITDPLTRAVMAADRISAEEMRNLLQAAWIAAQAGGIDARLLAEPNGSALTPALDGSLATTSVTRGKAGP